MRRASRSKAPKESELVTSGSARLATFISFIRQWADEVEKIRTPQEVFQEKSNPVWEAFDQELGSIERGSPCAGNATHGERVLHITDQIRELEQQYAATVKEEELAYLQQLEEHYNRFSTTSQDILGDSFTDAGIKTHLVDAQATTVARSDPQPESVVPSSADETAVLPISTTEVTMADPDDQSEEEDEVRQPTNSGDERHTEPKPQPVSDFQLKDRPHSDSERTSPCHPEPQPAIHSQTEPPPANSADAKNQPESPSHAGHVQASQPRPDPQPTSSPLSDPRSESVDHPDPQHAVHSDSGPHPSTQPENPSFSDPPQADRPHPDSQSLTFPAQRKRPINEPAEQDEPAKRPRKGDLPVLAENEATSIEFDQVFQDGNAKVKYQIARYPLKDGKWYILECKEHGKHFDKDPLIGASKHLSGASHGNLPRKRDIAVRLLGTVVLNCDAELARKNNFVALDAFAKGLGYPPGTAGQSSRPRAEGTTQGSGLAPVRRRISHPQTRDASHTRRAQITAPKVTNPQPGEVYVIYWKGSKAYYAVMILPWQRFKLFGWDKTLLKMGLLNDVPPCYIFNKKTDTTWRGWANGYEEGGSLFLKRQYPVIYFDENKFPDENSVGWVCMSDLGHFSAEDMRVQHREDVIEFLEKHQARSRSSHAEGKDSSEQVAQSPSPSQHETQGSAKERQVPQSPPPTTVQEQPAEENGPPSLISSGDETDDETDNGENEGDDFREREAEKDSDYCQEEENEDEHDEGQTRGDGGSWRAEVGQAGGVKDEQEQEQAKKDATDQGAGLETSRNDIQEIPYEDASGPDEDGRNHAGTGNDENHIIDASPDEEAMSNKPLDFDGREIANGQEIENGQDIGGVQEMEAGPYAENNLFFDYDPIWRQDGIANGRPGTPGVLSPSDTPSFVAELLQNREQPIGEAPGTSNSATVAPVTTRSSATCNPATEEPSQVDSHVSAEQSGQKQVQRESTEAERLAIMRATIAATLPTTNPATHPNMPVLRPMDDNLWKTQSPMIPPMLMPKDDDLAMIAAQAVMSSLPKAVQGGLPTQPREGTRSTRAPATGVSNTKPAESLSQHGMYSYLDTNTQDYRPLPPRRGSDFFNAVLGPRTETLPSTRAAGSQAAVALIAQEGTYSGGMENPRPNVEVTQSPRVFPTGSWDAYNRPLGGY